VGGNVVPSKLSVRVCVHAEYAKTRSAKRKKIFFMVGVLIIYNKDIILLKAEENK
jgi:hypothetical protein